MGAKNVEVVERKAPSGIDTNGLQRQIDVIGVVVDRSERATKPDGLVVAHRRRMLDLTRLKVALDGAGQVAEALFDRQLAFPSVPTSLTPEVLRRSHERGLTLVPYPMGALPSPEEAAEILASGRPDPRRTIYTDQFLTGVANGNVQPPTAKEIKAGLPGSFLLVPGVDEKAWLDQKLGVDNPYDTSFRDAQVAGRRNGNKVLQELGIDSQQGRVLVLPIQAVLYDNAFRGTRSPGVSSTAFLDSTVADTGRNVAYDGTTVKSQRRGSVGIPPRFGVVLR